MKGGESVKHCVCEYCGERFAQDLERCPHCGGRNRLTPKPPEAEARQTLPPVPESGILPPAEPEPPKKPNRKPRTIEELRQFAEARKLPLDKMRFHLGEDFRGPKAYGIFRAGDGTVTVYKNKADGSRAVRYQGPDEAFAVNEILLKMREEIAKQRSFQNALKGTTRGGSAPTGGGPDWLQVVKKNAWKYLLILALCFGAWALLRALGKSVTRGYYLYKDSYYYRQNDAWYQYVDDAWLPVVPDYALIDDADEYFADDDYDDAFGVDDFIGTPYYNDQADAPKNDGRNDDDHWGGWNDNDDDDWGWNDDDDDDWGWDDDDDDDWGWDNDDDWDWGGDWDDVGDWDDDW